MHARALDGMIMSRAKDCCACTAAGEHDDARAASRSARALTGLFHGRNLRNALARSNGLVAGTPFQPKVWTPRWAPKILPGHAELWRRLAAKSPICPCRRAPSSHATAPSISVVLPCHRLIGATGPGDVLRRAGAQRCLLHARGRLDSKRGLFFKALLLCSCGRPSFNKNRDFSYRGFVVSHVRTYRLNTNRGCPGP